MTGRVAKRTVHTLIGDTPIDILVGITTSRPNPWVVIALIMEEVKIGSITMPLQSWDEVSSAVDNCLEELGFIVDKRGK